MTILFLLTMLRYILGLNIADVSHFCLTWDIQNETLKLTCRVRQFEDAIYIHDIYGQTIGQCNSGNNSGCTTNQYSEMNAEIENKLVKLLIHIPSYGEIDGVWTCMQNGAKTTVVVSRHRGIVVDTDTVITGRFINEATKDIVLTCSSCRIPRMNLAEFFINGKTVDTIAYNDESSSCSHQHGTCRSNVCNCSLNIFVLFIRLPSNASNGHFSCDMRFDDVVKQISFDKFASVSLEDNAFRAEITSTNITKSESVPVTQTTPVAEITYSSVAYSHMTPTGAIPVQKDMNSLWIGILILFASFLAFGLIFIYREITNVRKLKSEFEDPFIEIESEDYFLRHPNKMIRSDFLRHSDKMTRSEFEDPVMEIESGDYFLRHSDMMIRSEFEDPFIEIDRKRGLYSSTF